VSPSKRLVAALVLGCLVLLMSPSAWAVGHSARHRARVAVAYLKAQQRADGAIVAFSPVGSTADAVVAMAAAKRAGGVVRDALRYERRHFDDVDDEGLVAKVAMAAVAGDRDPRAFAGHNLVRMLKRTERPSGRYGRGTPVLNQALVILALEGAGAEPSKRSLRWLASAQCRDGGWQYDKPSKKADDRHCRSGDGDFFASDTNTTSYALMALEAAEVRIPLAHNPWDYFRAQRAGIVKSDKMGRGWGYDLSRSLTDANSTGLVLQAYAAANKRPPRGSVKALKNLQYRRCGAARGAFAYSWERRNGGWHRTGRDVGATIGGILGLLRRPLPVGAPKGFKAAPTPRPCS
jgi:hypothetical protein